MAKGTSGKPAPVKSTNDRKNGKASKKNPGGPPGRVNGKTTLGYSKTTLETKAKKRKISVEDYVATLKAKAKRKKRTEDRGATRSLGSSG